MLRGTARIGQKALFPTQGPHASYPHSYRCHYVTKFFSWDSEHFLEIDGGVQFGTMRGEGGRGVGGEGTQQVKH